MSDHPYDFKLSDLRNQKATLAREREREKERHEQALLDLNKAEQEIDQQIEAVYEQMHRFLGQDYKRYPIGARHLLHYMGRGLPLNCNIGTRLTFAQNTLGHDVLKPLQTLIRNGAAEWAPVSVTPGGYMRYDIQLTELGKRLVSENPCPEPDITVNEARALVKRYLTADNNPVAFYPSEFRKGYGGNGVHSFTLLRLFEFGAVDVTESGRLMMFTPKGIAFLIRTANG